MHIKFIASRCRVRFVVLTVLFLCIQLSFAVNLKNWRLPYYRIAAKMEDGFPDRSTMFWDDITGLSKFISLNSFTDTGNYWLIEPAVSVDFEQTNRHFDSHIVHWGATFLSDFRYRNMLVRYVFDADSRYDTDSLYPAHPDRIARGRIEEGYVQLDYGYGFIRLGRLQRNWGPFIDRSLVLSSHPYSYDSFEWQIRNRFAEFRYVGTAFPVVNQSRLTVLDDNIGGRYLSAHVLNFTMGKWGAFGIGETILFHDNNGIPNLHYINPFTFYTLSNANQEGKGGNCLLFLQWNITPVPDLLSIKGQFLLDDFQVDREIEGDKEPNHWGLDAGVFIHDFLPISFKHVFGIEYEIASPWLYTVSDYCVPRGERYTFIGKSLGYDRNDRNRVSISFSALNRIGWGASVDIGYQRQGENTVRAVWGDRPDHPGLTPDYKNPSFPSGIVEETVAISVEGMSLIRDYLDCRFGITNKWINNEANVETGVFKYVPRFTIGLSLHLTKKIVSY